MKLALCQACGHRHAPFAACTSPSAQFSILYSDGSQSGWIEGGIDRGVINHTKWLGLTPVAILRAWPKSAHS